jgi:rhodanese-related sulfurtransferase
VVKKIISLITKHDMKLCSVIILYILIISASSVAQVPDSLKYRSLPPAEFMAAYQKAEKGVLIDVREFFEYRKSRIDNAINIPSSGHLESAADTIGKNNSLFFYCTSGFRSKRVAKYFYEKGFTNLYSLDGGIMLLKKEGFPVVRKKIRR